MNMILRRIKAGPDGVFSNLLDETQKPFAVTLEHAYLQSDNLWAPKVPTGSYRCVRGMHLLHNSKAPFQTFEVTGVEGHSGILFHIGNYNLDSDGCILLGDMILPGMIAHSITTFAKFMELQKDVDNFTLLVI